MQSSSIRRHSIYTAILSLLAFLLIQSCSDSNSDVVLKSITNPGTISPVIALSRYIDSNNSRSEVVRAQLFDKNLNAVQILGGSIMVNDSLLTTTSTGYECVLDSVPFIHSDSLYTITIVLSDSQAYNCTVRAPKSDLTTLYAPTYQSRSASMPISWQEVDSIGPQRLDYYYYFQQNNQLYYGMTSYVIWAPETGVFSVSAADLNVVPNISTAKLVLHYSIDGTIDPAFRTGGSIGVDFAVEKIVSIID